MDDVKIIEIPAHLDVPGVKFHFGIDKYKVWRHIAHRNFKAYKDGKKWVIVTASILKHLKKNCNIRGEHNVEQP